MTVTSPPATYLNWTPSGLGPNVIQPPAGQSNTGWTGGEAPPYQYANYLEWLTDQWIQYLNYARQNQYPYDIIVGSEPFCTDPTLAEAVGNAAYGANQTVLLFDSYALGTTTVNLTKAGWRIDAMPGVVYSGTSGQLSMQANDIRIRFLRMTGFTTAIAATLTGTYCRVLDCNFYGCTTSVDDSLAPAGKKVTTLGNIVEVYP